MKTWRPVFYGLAAFWLLLGLSSGNRIFFVLFAVQALLVLAALIMNLWAALSFTYLQELSVENTLRGRPVQLNLSVFNEKAIPYPMMRICLATANPQEQRQLDFNLSARSRLHFDLTLECPHRGEFQIGMTIIDIIDIFGILRLPFDMRLLPYYRLKNLLVYPRLSELSSLPMPALGNQRFSRQNFATEDVHEPFSTVRSYRRGDPRKLIHWPASIRQQKLLTRQFEQAAEPRVLLIMDLQKPGGNSENALQAIDICCECMAAMIHYLLRQGFPLQIISIGSETKIQTCSKPQDFQRLYSWLARIAFDGSRPLHLTLPAILASRPEAQAVLLVTADIRPELLPVLAGMRRDETPVYSLFASPSGSAATEAAMASQMQQSGLPAWFIHYGELLEDQLKVDS